MKPDKSSHFAGRDASGRFRKGCSGNPLGKPKGTQHALVKHTREAALKVALPRVIAAAEEGDLDACRTLLSLGFPKLRPAPEPLELGIASDAPLVEKLAAISEAALAGRIAPDDAAKLAELVQKANTSAMMRELSQKVGVLISPDILSKEDYETSEDNF